MTKEGGLVDGGDVHVRASFSFSFRPRVWQGHQEGQHHAGGQAPSSNASGGPGGCLANEGDSPAGGPGPAETCPPPPKASACERKVGGGSPVKWGGWLPNTKLTNLLTTFQGRQKNTVDSLGEIK